MSDYASILERARDAFASASRLEQAMQRMPNDPALEMNWRSRKRLAERYQQQLFAAAKGATVDVCQYRLRPETANRYPIASVSRSLERFQELFSLTFDALDKGIAKNTSHLGEAVRRQTEFEFGYSYAGSLGIVLLVPSSRDLISTKFDESIAAIDQLLSIADADEVIDVSHRLGRAVINKAYSWSIENYNAEFSVDILWRKSTGDVSGQAIDRSQMARLANIIEQTSEEEATPIEARGVLVGIDVPSRWFHFVVPKGESYSGRLGDDFPTVGTIEVNRAYRAFMVEQTTTKFATGDVQRRYVLSRLAEIDPSA